MINEHENLNVGVYWDDIIILGWKLSEWLNARVIFISKKYSWNSLSMTQYLCCCWDRLEDAGCYFLLYAPVEEQGAYTAIYKYCHSNFYVKKQNCDAQTHE